MKAKPLHFGDGPRAALLLHGFTGAPSELEDLARSLADRGYRVDAPLLPGHGTTVADLNTKRADDWLNAARDAYLQIRDSHEHVSLVGFSMGGLISLTLAAEDDIDARACAVMSPPLFMPSLMARIALPVLKWTGLARLIRTLEKVPTGLPSQVEEKRFVYDAWPVPALTEFHRVMKRARAALPRVQAPVLALYGALDPTAPPRNADYLLSRVRSSVRESEIYEHSGHVLPLDREAGAVIERVGTFLDAQ